MPSLNLTSRPLTKLPASAFPSRADVYVCDTCGRDVTKQLRPHRGHAWTPMGPERFLCPCGQKHLTGATEWDHFSERNRKQRVRQILGLGVLFSLLFSILGLLAYLVLHFVFGLKEGAFATGLVIAALPFFFVQITFWPYVVASMWRTRFATSVASQRNDRPPSA